MNTPGRITHEIDEAGDDPVARIATHLRQADYRQPPPAEILELSEFVYNDEDDADQAQAGASKGGLILTCAMLALAAAWIGFVLWLAASNPVLSDMTPLLTTVAAGVAPLLLIVLIWIVARRRPDDPVGRLQTYARAFSEETQGPLQQIADAESRLGGACATIRQHSREAATLADSSASALLASAARIEELCARVDTILKESGATANAVLAQIGALEEAAPRMDDRLAGFATSLAQSCDDIAARGATLDEQIRTAAIIAEEARLQLTLAHGATIAQIDVLQKDTRQAGDELTKLSELASARVDLTLERARSAVDETRQQLDSNNVALETLVERSSTTLDAMATSSVATFSGHMDEIVARLSAADAALGAHGERGTALFDSLGTGITELGQKLAALQSDAETGGQKIAGTLVTLIKEADGLESSLGRGNAAADQFIQRAESLLLALDSDLRELNESLPIAFDRVDTRLSATRGNLAETVSLVSSMQTDADAILERLMTTKDAVVAQAEAIDTAIGDGDTGLHRQTVDIAALRQALEENRAILAQLNEQAAPQVLQTLEQVRETADAAALHARRTIESAIGSAVSQLEEASGAALEAAVGRKVNDQLHQIAEIADNAVKSVHRATDHLMRQMIALTDSAADLEGRIVNAAHVDEGRNQNFVAERSAHIIASLQDSAIDISKSLSKDVGEKDWSAYLNGDKSLFARRAVRLLSSGDLRKVQAHYHDDPQFQEHVNRYVGDFEVMLQGILAGRSGNNLAIALLSSDVGKLYVALAQAIERLRVA